MITVPSPPGRWNALRSARAHSRPRTPTATTKMAASTNEYTWKAFLESAIDTGLPLTRATPVSWYQGSSIEASSAIAAIAASR